VVIIRTGLGGRAVSAPAPRTWRPASTGPMTWA
jgi:hypothetical protein